MMQHPNGRITGKLLALMLGGLLCVTLGATWLLKSSAAGPSLAQGGELAIWLSGDTLGYLEPCGCRRDQAGGIEPRMTLVKGETSPHRLLLDVGNLTSGSRSYELLKLDFLLRGMAEMGYDAVNLGLKEASLDRDTLRQKMEASKLPFISCNVLNTETSKPLAAPSLIVSIAGKRIGITGVVEMDRDDVGPGLAVRPPEEALSAILPDLRKRSDFVIVLAFAPQETLRSLATRFPEAGAIFGGDVPQASSKAEIVNRSVLFNVTNKGKVIGRLAFKEGGDAGLTLSDSKSVKTTDKIPPAPEMSALIKEFKNTLRERNIELASAEGMELIHAENTSADTYTGQDKCQPCHQNAFKITHATTHTHAYETLVAKNSEYDPDCLRCHTVGYGARDGYVNHDKTPKLAGVQCENCHGRGASHMQAIAAGKKGKAATEMLRAVTPNSCVRCHDEENSENFQYSPFWQRMKHGSEPGMSRTAATQELRRFLARVE
jgi:hypothetical protein